MPSLLSRGRTNCPLTQVHRCQNVTMLHVTVCLSARKTNYSAGSITMAALHQSLHSTALQQGIIVRVTFPRVA